MNGTPWRQVQGALEKMLELTQGQGNIRSKEEPASQFDETASYSPIYLVI